MARGRTVGFLATALVAASVTVGAGAARPASPPPYAAECAVVGPGWRPTVGAVDCGRLPAPAQMGAAVPFSYFVPPACAVGDRRCPVLYYTHGTGGSYREFIGAKGATSRRALIAALTSAPPGDPSHVPDPWRWADPTTWVPAAPIDLIVVVPEGRTLPGGFGPAPGMDTGWTDWNPRYAAAGDTPRYDTPPPRIESFVVERFVPFVDATFPAIPDRTGRALLGTSQGGFGSYKLGLAHPDIWSSLGMLSGGGFPIPSYERLGIDPPAGVQPPADVPYTKLPGALGAVAPDPLLAVNLASEVSVGFGDPVADQTYWRAASPPELVSNARAGAGGVQSLHLRHLVNDAIPRRAADFADLESYAAAQAFETALLPLNLYLERVFDANGVEREFEIHPGLHSSPYWNPFLRAQLASQYANLRHHDGGGSPRPWPTRFDHRSAATDYTIWGWRVRVTRDAVEFLELTDVTCSSVTVHGSGVVRLDVPEACGTGVGGSRTFEVDLGPGQLTDDPAGLSSSRAYGTTRTIALTPLRRAAT